MTDDYIIGGCDMAALRAYAVGSRFSSRDADGTDDYGWRPTDRYWTDVEYRRPRPKQPRGSGTRRRTASAVTTRIDPSRIRTPEQRRAVAQRLATTL